MSRRLPGLVALFVAALSFGLGADLQEIDPATYAEVGHGMALTGRLFLLEDNGHPYIDKPPVTFWLIAASERLLGTGEVAVRLPSLVLAVVATLSLLWLGTLLWNRRAGLLAALFFVSSTAARLMTIDPKIDMVLIGWMTLAMALLVAGRRRPAWLPWGYGALALAFLTKGPIGVGIPILAFSGEALARRDLERIRPLRPVAGLAGTAALVAPFYVVTGLHRGASALRFMLLEQSFGRFTESRFNYGGDPFFYVHTFAWAFLPWSLLLGARLWERLRGERGDEGESFVLVWWLLPFVVLSLALSKLPQYIFWVLPPAALMAARWVDRRIDAEPGARSEGVFRVQEGVGWGLLALLGGIFLFCFPPPTRFGWIPLLVAGAGAVGVALGVRDPLGRALGVTAAAMLAVDVSLGTVVYPEALRYQPFKPMALRIRSDPALPPGPVFGYGTQEPDTIPFYSGRPIRGVERIEELDRWIPPGERALLLTLAERLPEIEAGGYRLRVLETRPSFPTSSPTPCFLLERRRATCAASMVLAIAERAGPAPAKLP